MPGRISIADANRRRPSTRVRGVISLLVTVLLCLPSLAGGAALFLNLLLRRDIEQWEEISSALIASGVFFGAPLVGMAAIAGAVTAFNRSMSGEMKFAHLFVVSLAAIASLSLRFRFGS